MLILMRLLTLGLVLELHTGKYDGQKFMFDPLLNHYGWNISLGLKQLLSEDHLILD